MRNNLQSLLTLCWLWIVLQERAWECLPGEREKECLRWPSPILRQNFCQFWKKHQRCHLYQAVLKMFTLFRKFLHSSTLGDIFDINVLLMASFAMMRKCDWLNFFVKKRKYHWWHAHALLTDVSPATALHCTVIRREHFSLKNIRETKIFIS